MKKTITIKINGETRDFEIDPHEKLLNLLRRSGYKGPKEGCDEGTCGACTVILDGRAIYSCIAFAYQAHGRELRTIEGVGDFDNPTPIQQALIDEGAVQCGYCTPGIVLSVKALLDQNPHPTDQDILEHMDGNLCRCTGYEKILVAIQKTVAANAPEVTHD